MSFSYLHDFVTHSTRDLCEYILACVVTKRLIPILDLIFLQAYLSSLLELFSWAHSAIILVLHGNQMTFKSATFIPSDIKCDRTLVYLVVQHDGTIRPDLNVAGECCRSAADSYRERVRHTSFLFQFFSPVLQYAAINLKKLTASSPKGPFGV